MGSACCGCKKELSLLETFPEKQGELQAYLDTLPLGADIEQNRGYLIQSLHKAQHIFGYLPEDIQAFIAETLGLHLSAVYGVISFYSFFTDQPVGKYKINVCTGTACFVKGSAGILKELEELLELKEGETSSDLMYSVGGIRCVGACGLAPVVTINDKVYGKVKPKEIAGILKTYLENNGEEIK
jgi:NADH:ubiquinone oxidoreductase subunit E